MRKSINIILLVASMLIMAGCASSHKQESTGEYIDNSAITATVKAKLLADSKMSSFPITVNTYKGTVQLSGFVNSQEQKQRAAEIARNVKGVKVVQNALVVKKK